jgi:pimeloyl-ACP methyl ester carboxylesterase
MSTLGMDTEAGLAASGELDAGSQKIAELATRLDSALHGFDWTGTDADRTLDTWQQSGKPALDTTVTQLASMALLIRQEAQAQDAVSGDGTASAGAGGAVGSAQPQGFFGKVGQFLTDRISAAYDGLKRTLGHELGFFGKVVDVLTGKEDHSVSEIAASALLTVGSAAGTVANIVTGKDQHWFAEGTGVAGIPSAVAAQGEGGLYSPALAPPTDLPSLMQGVTDSYQVGKNPDVAGGDVRITRVDNGNGPAYVVSIPGTETWSPAAGSEPRDLSANLALVAGGPTAAAQSVRAALDAAGIPPGSPVMLVGHSQGGIIAGQLASDPAFVREYGITNVMTYGAPIDHMQLAPGVEALQVQHQYDVVPRLDPGVDVNGVNPNTHVTGVTLGSPGGMFGVVANHDHTAYINSVREAMASDSDAGRILRDYQSTLAPFLVTPSGSATAIDVPVTRRP